MTGGICVLVLEDDELLRWSIADSLRELGCKKVGSFSSNEPVLPYLAYPRRAQHIGLPDVHLGRGTCYRTFVEFGHRKRLIIFMSGIVGTAPPPLPSSGTEGELKIPAFK
ncbi:hypothetical protein Acid7E03_44210 [Acidisoma sp. 7E03]